MVIMEMFKRILLFLSAIPNLNNLIINTLLVKTSSFYAILFQK